MKNNFKIFWPTLGITLFLISSLFNFSDIGNDFSLLWRIVSLWNILLYISAAICVGLLLALCLLRKQPYKKRILFTISISFITLSVYQLTEMAIFKYGLRQEYNYFTAKRDVKKGNVQVLDAGLIIYFEHDTVLNERTRAAIEKKYGFKSKEVGCIYYEGIGFYNNVMEDYLVERNGPNWRSRFNKEISLAKKKQKNKEQMLSGISE
jgi:hypothetical protein